MVRKANITLLFMSLKNISFPEEPINYLIPTWDEINGLAFKIARQMLKDGKKFDRIVTLAKGGWPMTRSLVDFLSVDKVVSLGIKFYSGINQRFSEPKIYQDFPVKLTNEIVLLFDDVADTGQSFQFTKNHLQKNNVKSITTASLFYKPHSLFQPDYYGFKTSAWIIFPYETIESIKFLLNKWTNQGLTPSVIKARFLRFGFPKNQDFYPVNFQRNYRRRRKENQQIGSPGAFHNRKNQTKPGNN
ncbi:MAG: Phosphoribosyltransferase [Candidatus Beckwithbacteria bacterium GW2011_GWA2_43_10]|uniref:Phosphoribosyltransferase n=1 Tax=Candidatus Beckwithbacteria bacterium GW2011_GWA2_43_10 TaxID=1618369 RepID=A0A0G1EA29_9BACT|nr:MAG: Phosphoribosyltransferase [Candidatus Beckwithbacteria bacterium GW2011_GWA2_43_10]